MLLILGLHMGSNKRANGVAQRQRRDWGDSFLIIAQFWQSGAYYQWQSRCPPGAVVGTLLTLEGAFTKTHLIF
jgi:hypothetical protein